MPTFRIQKTRDYTVMSNAHFKDIRLSLKAKGLLSFMLSLPENWDYTERGLAATCSDGRDSLRSAIKELENAGYLVRSRVRDSYGRLRDTEYVIYEVPQTTDNNPDGEGSSEKTDKNPDATKTAKINDGQSAKPKNKNSKKPICTEKDTYVGKSNTGKNEDVEKTPALEKPTQVSPTQVSPTQVNTTQAIYNVKSNTKKTNMYDNIRSYHINTSEKTRYYADTYKTVCEKIRYDCLKEKTGIDVSMLDLIVEVLTRTLILCSQNPSVRVAKVDYPADIVSKRLMSLDSSHIEYVIDCIENTKTKIIALDRYILSSLFNAPHTKDNYYKKISQHNADTLRKKENPEFNGDSFDVDEFFKLAVKRGESSA